MDKSVENTKSVRFSKRVDDRLSHIALKLGRSKRDVVVQMVDYFYASKKDPADLSDELLKRELSSGVNRILSFIRQQETDILVPMVSGQRGISESASRSGALANALAQQQVLLIGAIKENAELVAKSNTMIVRLYKLSQQKAELKKRVTEILESYILQREALGWSTSQVKKDQLTRSLWREIENL